MRADRGIVLETGALGAPASGQLAEVRLPAPLRGRSAKDWARIGCAVGVACFVLLSLAYCWRRFPVWDEGLYADVAHHFAIEGRLRSGAMGPVGDFGWDPLPGVDRRTYWTTAAYPLAIGTWFRLVGSGLVQMRLPGIAFGLLLIAAWASIVRSATGSRTYAYAAAALVATGSHVLWAGSIGRPDMMSASAASVGIAAYLGLRSRSMRLALCAAAGCFSIALQAHPMALVEGAGLAALVLAFDRRALRALDLLLALGVGLLLLAPWIAYVLQDYDLFRAQWGANSHQRAGGLVRPWEALLTDLRKRYVWWHFGDGLSGIRGLELTALGVCFAIAAGARSVRRTPGLGMLALLAGVGWVSLALLDGKRWIQYFLHVFPAYSALAAVVVCRIAAPGTGVPWPGARRALAGLLVLMMIVPGVGGISLRLADDRYSSGYLPAVRALQPYHRAGATIQAPSELGFALGFDGRVFRDDQAMRATPDVYVRNQYTALEVAGPWQAGVKRRLAREYEKVFESDFYTIYVRREYPERLGSDR